MVSGIEIAARLPSRPMNGSRRESIAPRVARQAGEHDVNLLKRDTSHGKLKGKRKRAGWNTKFLEKLLFG